MKVISICNQKGGVGKTTTATNLAAAFALKGKSVLLVDLDPQATLSEIMGMRDKENGLPEALEGKCPVRDVLYKWSPPAEHFRHRQEIDITIIPNSAALTLKDRLFHQIEEKKSYLVIDTILKAIDKEHSYDVAVLDLEPGFSIFTRIGVAASDHVIIPVQPETVTITATADMIEWIKYISGVIGKEVNVLGLMVVQYDSRLKLHEKMWKLLKDQKSIKVYRPFIKRLSVFPNSQAEKVPAVLYQNWHQGSREYIEVAKEVMKDVGF